MGHILSQQEIDALLSALPVEKTTTVSSTVVGGRPDKAVKPYDFTRPDKFSKDQIRTLEMMHENFARRTQAVLSAYLRTVIQVSLVSVEQEIYEEFIQQLPSPVVLAVIGMEPLEGRAIVALNTTTAYTIIDRLLGGVGQAMETNRQMTDIEISLMDGILLLVLQNLGEAWANVQMMTPRLQDIAFTPQFLQVASGTDVVLTVRFELRMGDFSGSLNLCIPYAVIEPVMARLSAQSFFAGTRKAVTQAAQFGLRKQIDKVLLPVVAVLGESNLSVEELLSLQPGDVLQLNSQPNQELVIKVHGIEKFRGRPGTVGRHSAVQITGIVEEEEMFEEQVEEDMTDAF